MTFANQQVALETLPRYTEVEFHALDPHHARVVLGIALALQIPVLLVVTGLLFAVLVPSTDLSLLAGSALLVVVLCVFAFLAWFSFKSAQVMRYALRQHDVIVQSGVFWTQETVQPIRRIQHIEQHQGPIDKRFGLYELKLFSAGTGHFTLRIPGLDAGSAAGIRQFILKVQEDGWEEEEALGSDEPAAPPRFDD
jgi:uncharacterized protein